MKKSLWAFVAAALLAVLAVGCTPPNGTPNNPTPIPSTSTPTSLPPAPTNTGGSPQPSLEVPPPIY